jgi:hypothetical protein
MVVMMMMMMILRSSKVVCNVGIDFYYYTLYDCCVNQREAKP